MFHDTFVYLSGLERVQGTNNGFTTKFEVVSEAVRLSEDQDLLCKHVPVPKTTSKVERFTVRGRSFDALGEQFDTVLSVLHTKRTSSRVFHDIFHCMFVY